MGNGQQRVVQETKDGAGADDHQWNTLSGGQTQTETGPTSSPGFIRRFELDWQL